MLTCQLVSWIAENTQHSVHFPICFHLKPTHPWKTTTLLFSSTNPLT